MAKTQNEITNQVTEKYLGSLDPANTLDPSKIEEDLIAETNTEFSVENTGRIGTHRINLLKALTHTQVAWILVELHHAVAIISSRSENARPSDLDPLAIWQPESGTYTQSFDAIHKAIRLYNSGATEQFRREVLAALRDVVPHVRRQTSAQWAAVANGDYNRNTGEVHDFSHERVFLARVPIDFDRDAQNPVIHNDDGTDWDVDSGLLEIANGDQGTLQLVWEMFAAVTQPHVRTNKAIALYNPKGNNGKGTLVGLAQNLVGDENYLSASIAELGKDATQPLIPGKSLITSDENATNDFVKFAEIIKKLATRESILVNPKYKNPFNDIFEGNQIHCLNGLLRSGDFTDSFWRRWLFIPLLTHFEGRERMYIKDDYIKRPEVLRYVLKRALEMDFIGFSETDATHALMREMKLHSDPVRRFWDELREDLAWDLLPLEFLYELYKAWSVLNKPEGRKVDRTTFDVSIRAAVEDFDDGWTDLGKGERMKVASRMAAPEPLLRDYELPDKWRSPFDRKMQYRNVIYRDLVARVLSPSATASPAEPVTVTATPEQVIEVERLHAEEATWWEQQAVDVDGVTDLNHVREHAKIRRLGSSCTCPPSSRTGPQNAYPADILQRSRNLDAAFSDTHEDRDDVAA